VGDDRFKHEWSEQDTGQQPAVETDLGRKYRPYGEFVDNGVARPDKDREQGVSVLHQEQPEH